jgi:hypothetical protein
MTDDFGGVRVSMTNGQVIDLKLGAPWQDVIADYRGSGQLVVPNIVIERQAIAVMVRIFPGYVGSAEDDRLLALAPEGQA